MFLGNDKLVRRALAREEADDGRVGGGEDELARVLTHHHAEQGRNHGRVEKPAHAEPEGNRDADAMNTARTEFYSQPSPYA